MSIVNRMDGETGGLAPSQGSSIAKGDGAFAPPLTGESWPNEACHANDGGY